MAAAALVAAATGSPAPSRTRSAGLSGLSGRQPCGYATACFGARADAPLAPTVRALLQRAADAGLQMSCVEQATCHTQFEHLRCLARMLAHQPPAWVFFSDDDDIWSRRRYALYAQQCAAAPADARALLCRRKACFLRRVLHIATDADSVREMLASGVLRLADSDLKDGLEEHEHNMAEYFDLAVRYDAFAQFFATMPPCVTQHKLCDLAFTFLYCRDRNTIRWIPDDDDFVYFYSRGAHAGGASNSVESVPRHELEQALQLLQEAPREVQRSFSSPQAFHGFVASMRQAIEQEMIMIRATGRVVPAQIIYAAYGHVRSHVELYVKVYYASLSLRLLFAGEPGM
ncbi:hypothetical protein AB1Y20_012224 [Prymnesium parvum]|uniref:Uncharacterized protein n=1 Tax=Prymnesium parvum TaxID=97485 RepID=A0AB34IRE5_PRYPA